MIRPLIYGALFVALCAIVAAFKTAPTDRGPQALRRSRERPSPAEIRYEALGAHVGKVRIVHPLGREGMAPREHVKALKEHGWRESPEPLR